MSIIDYSAEIFPSNSNFREKLVVTCVQSFYVVHSNLNRLLALPSCFGSCACLWVQQSAASLQCPHTDLTQCTAQCEYIENCSIQIIKTTRPINGKFADITQVNQYQIYSNELFTAASVNLAAICQFYSVSTNNLSYLNYLFPSYLWHVS